ncbi:MAG: signal recognition particle-docking protein FtsY [Lachnospiraceae bacterium]|nr:signal recognition particle-docking protein FtsY [Lachnospiraceae bacterium]
MAIGLFKKIKGLFGMEVLDDDFYDELEETLILADVGVKTTEELMDSLHDAEDEKIIKTPADCKQFLIDFLKKKMTPSDGAYDFENKKTVILVVGVNGVGKTTSIGKLAAHYKSRGKKVILAAADTFRAGATEQLQLWADRTGVRIIAQGDGADPAAVVFDAVAAAKASGADILICDTAGRLHNKKNLMNELAKIYRVLEREYSEAHLETLLVLDSTTGQNAVNQAAEFSAVTEINGIILSKTDGTAKGGIAIAIESELGIPVKYVGTGEKAGDIAAFDASKYIDEIFE